MGIIGNLLVRVGADVNPLQKGLGRAQNSLADFSRNAGNSMKAFNVSASNQIQTMNLQMAKAQALSQLATAKMVGFGNVSQIAATKLNGLKSQLEIQSRVVKQLESEFHKAVFAEDMNVAHTRKLEIQLIQARTAEQNLKNDISKTSKALKESAEASKNANSFFGKYGASIKQFSVVAAIASLTAFIAISKNAIKAAMDVTESENLFEVSMGNMAGAARQWSDQLQQSLGLNGYEIRKNVGLFYNMTTAMGLARDKAYDVSTGITQLAYDMSSFYNISYDEMFVKLQAGLSGEIEPLRRLGVIVSETTVKNYAYRNGIAKLGAELTESQKVLARYGVIMDSTKNAQGDLARTITSPANQLRILQTQLQLASINMGNAFMPIVERVLPVLTSFAKNLVVVTNTFAQFMRALFGSNSAQAQNAQSAAKAATAQTGLGDAVAASGAKAKKGIASFDEINQLQEDMAASAGAAADATATTPLPDKSALADIEPPAWIKTMAEDLRSKFGPALKDFQDSWTKLGDAIAGVKENKAFMDICRAIGDLVAIGAAGQLRGVSGALDVLSGAIKMLFPKEGSNDVKVGAETLVTGILKIGDAVATTLLGPFKPIVYDALIKVSKAIYSSWDWLTTEKGFPLIVTRIADAIKLKVGLVKEGIVSKFRDITDGVKGVWSGLVAEAGTIWGRITSTINNTVQNTITAINNLITAYNKLPVLPDIPLIKSQNTKSEESKDKPWYIPTVKHAVGGIFNSPTLIGNHQFGESGREALLPLDSNTGWIDDLASKIVNGMMAVSQFGGGKSQQAPAPILEIDGVQLGRVLNGYIDREKARIGNTVVVGV